ncbi:uncharacterized protein NECHADRAFT_34067 [Fusarium vanettenii 77-13-4]|uniref:Uncharacterized protein n=1 Tax=Fusarium vanettenii (strain ATCC MYA-4622 / CBS 123669 / FGSC 9596 / NRRL 45880 / 77-13-4) TaxID=660122 RepID=C7Z541_FUSV7|nr:uncharacterized protein NECHADRAFT_34067 [Fusarium vanettenii 77-13-4]EEU41034.1 hypothetical protein NECHADRAFT_34067 [Fusarium vanettenii 77-13-4]
MEHLSGPVILCCFCMSSVAYWHVFVVVDYLLRKWAPDVYKRLEREDIVRKLNPYLIMIVRMIIGLFVSLPACVQAIHTTTWGVYQPLSTSGQICVVSQLVVWSNELPVARLFSPELFVHHLLCLAATSNILISPPVHQIKPLYIYFASLVGDIGPGSADVLHPFNLADWVWVLAVMLFGFYSLYSAFRNLKWLGVIRVHLVQYRVTYFCRFMVPVAHTMLGAACGVTLLSALFLYGLYLDRPLRASEIGLISINGLVAAAIGLTGAIITGIALPYGSSRSTPWGSQYLQVGILLAGLWAHRITKLTDYVDRETILSSMGVSLPLFQAFARLAHYYSAKDAVAASGEKLYLDETPAKRHLQVMCENITTFLVALALLVFNILTVSEAGRLAVAACAVNQLRVCSNTIPISCKSSQQTARALFTMARIAVDHFVVAFLVAARHIRPEASWTDVASNSLLLGGTVFASLASRSAVTIKKPCEVVTKVRKTKKWNPAIFIFVFMCILQSMLVKKYLSFEAGSREVSVGFKNFRAILSDPITWAGVLHLSSLPVVVLSGLG